MHKATLVNVANGADNLMKHVQQLVLVTVQRITVQPVLEAFRLTQLHLYVQVQLSPMELALSLQNNIIGTCVFDV